MRDNALSLDTCDLCVARSTAPRGGVVHTPAATFGLRRGVHGVRGPRLHLQQPVTRYTRGQKGKQQPMACLECRTVGGAFPTTVR